MLSKMFPNFFGINADGKSALSTGGNPGRLNGADRENIANASQLSDSPTQQSVFRLAENTGIAEAQTILLQEESQLKLQAQDIALANLNVRVSHADQSLKKAKAYKQIVAKHGKNILNHEIESQVIQHNLDGYQSALQSAESKVHL